MSWAIATAGRLDYLHIEIGLCFMAHELTSKQGRPYLDPQEAVHRLKTAFKYVHADIDRATKELEETIQYMLRASEIFTDEDIEKVKRARGKSIHLSISDGNGFGCLEFVIEPDEKLFFSYESGQHEDAVRPMVERVARVLNYDIELV